MPELPEVEIVRRKLLPVLRGRRILDFWTDWPRGLRAKRKLQIAKDMRGRTILDISRRGKVLFFGLSGKGRRTLAVHLGMSGRLSTRRAEPGVEPERWAHFRWQLDNGGELRLIDPRKFGRVWYGSEAELGQEPYLASLGYDALAVSRRHFFSALCQRRSMAKPALLRQDIIAGVGNIIADESLWGARIHPRSRLADLTEGDLNRLHRALIVTVRTMLAAGGTSLRNWRHPEGERGHYQERRKIYGKAGKPCPRCRTRLVRIVVGNRGTTLCPTCQSMTTRQGANTA